MRKAPERYFFWGIPVLFAVGGLFHFVYGWSGESFAVGLIAPVNESIFEHVKLYPFPAVLWYGLLFLRRREELDADRWFTAALFSVVTQALAVVFLYYVRTGAFGLHSLAADILTFLAAVALGQLVGLHVYRRGRGLDRRAAVALLAACLLVFALLTLAPPPLPLFLDPVTNTYGMPG